MNRATNVRLRWAALNGDLKIRAFMHM